MKILMLTSYMDIGGAETHIAALCRGLSAAGHTVEVASSGGRYADILEKEGIVQHILPLDRKAPLSAAKCLRTLRRLISEGEYDIVHVHSRIPAVLCGVIAKRLGIGFVTTAHLDFRVNPVLRRLTEWGDAVMAVSDDIADYLCREYGTAREKVSVTVNGIDTDSFAPSINHRMEIRREFAIGNKDRLIVYISRLDGDRSLPAKLLCRIMPKVCRLHPNTKLLIVGDGDDADEVSRLAGEANSHIGKSAVLLAGARYDVNKIVAAADMVCAVSRAALEAMAAGCPVILSGGQGHMGIFNRDKLKSAAETNFCCRGYPLPTEDILFTDVERLLEADCDTLQDIGRYNRETVSKNYSVGRMISDYTVMYENTLKERHGGRIEAVISGYYGYGNSGDDASLDCLVAAIRNERPGANVAVLCRTPAKFGEKHGVIGIGRYDILSVVHAIRESGVLISGGGSLFQNATSTRSLRYYAGIIGLAKLCGAKVFICANGVGPLTGDKGRRIAYKSAVKADRISVRDSLSKKALTELGIPENAVSVTADPAFRLALGDMCDVSLIKHKTGMRDDMKYFAVSLREAMCRGERARELCRYCREIYLSQGYAPIFVSMQESEDGELCRAFAAAVCGEAISVPALPPDMLRSLIAETEFVISMRLHLIIYAAASGVPAVGISVDPKLDALADVLGSVEIVKGPDFSADSCLAASRRALCTDRNKLSDIAKAQAYLVGEDARAAVLLMKGEEGCGEPGSNGTAARYV